MITKFKTLILCIVIPLAVGGLSAFLSMDGIMAFEQLTQPPLTPPQFVFPIIWTILYILMGVASYLVITSDKNKSEIDNAITTYGLQLAVNFFWPILFFNLGWYLFSFIWLLFLWVLILITILKFYRISKTSAYLLIPYIMWVSFAGYLNFGIFLLN